MDGAALLVYDLELSGKKSASLPVSLGEVRNCAVHSFALLLPKTLDSTMPNGLQLEKLSRQAGMCDKLIVRAVEPCIWLAEYFQTTSARKGL